MDRLSRPHLRLTSLSLLSRLLESLVREGRLTIVDARGRSRTFGVAASDLEAGVRFNDAGLPRQLLLNPTLALGEAYMDGRLTIERGDLRSLLRILTSNLKALDELPLQKLRVALGRLVRPLRGNSRRSARGNAAHHYDLSGELYRLFLDSDRQYSCGYFPTGEESLDEAQAAKKRHLAAKLRADAGQTVLDIGSGWGGLALELARDARVAVKGITLSTEQLREARARASAADLADRVRFDLQDYRDERGEYDRIVSVGMFEHVGTAHYGRFFETVARCLKPDGVALIHSIGRRAPPGRMDPWIAKYIFPGSYVPSLSEVLPAVERSGLWVTDIEILRLHYAETLERWYGRFQRHREEARALYDERFCRMWEFYLASCEMMFRQGDLMVFQMQLARDPAAVPLTRDYIADFERSAMAERKTEPGPARVGRCGPKRDVPSRAPARTRSAVHSN